MKNDEVYMSKETLNLKQIVEKSQLQYEDIACENKLQSQKLEQLKHNDEIAN
jgi:hypothetical protein